MFYAVAVTGLISLGVAARAVVYRRQGDDAAYRKSLGLAGAFAFLFACCLVLVLQFHFPWGGRSCAPSYASRIC